MFTGLIEDTGILKARTSVGSEYKLIIETALPLEEIRLGDSIAINGACLTVEEMSAKLLTFHTLAETLRRTSIGDVNVGGRVNMERALKMGARLDGHLVSGHVDSQSSILKVDKTADDITVTLSLPKGYEHLFIEKGSVAIDGISLTIADLTESSFSVCLIPHSWAHTNLQERQPGDKVNIETDMIGKYIQRSLSLGKAGIPESKSNITMETLFSAGF